MWEFDADDRYPLDIRCGDQVVIALTPEEHRCGPGRQ